MAERYEELGERLAKMEELGNQPKQITLNRKDGRIVGAVVKQGDRSTEVRLT